LTVRSLVLSRFALTLLALAFVAKPVSAAASPSSANAIVMLLNRSAAAWNRGDLTTFMRSYENSPETVYISAHAVIHGYANIRAHYSTAHPGAMGTLSFSDLAIRPLGADYAVVVARWHLAMPAGKSPSGLFSLVLHHSAAGWEIITDHSP
jgi:ketosteroid isomerase-like protein